jgi:hypothetical protein
MDEIKVDSSRGLIIDRAPEDFEFGASKLSSTRKVLCPDGQWTEYLPAHFELQRNNYFDSYGCVSYSRNNAHEILHKRLYGYDIDWDDRDLVVGSGTKPNQGNGVKAVADWARKYGTIKDRGDIPATMFQDEYYAWKRGETENNEASKTLELFDIGYEWLPTYNWSGSYSSSEQLMEALLYSPIQASVDGNYQYNADGTIGRLINWSHEIVIVGYVKGKYWLIYDSECEQLLKFEWTYKFGFPISHSLKKKNMQLYKKIGSPAIYFKRYDKNSLIPFSDGSITGGELFKSIYGLDYSLLPIEKVNELPFPVEEMELKVI